MANGTKREDNFWEVGLRFLLLIVFSWPLVLLMEYLARFDWVRSAWPVVIGVLVGGAIGDWVFRRLQRRKSLPASNQD